jgi:Na+/proline symporter
MFTEDIFAYYGGKDRFGEKAQVWTGRAFVVITTLVAYLIALELKDKVGIFELAIRFAFSGFAALSPVMLAALFWKRSTKWGALAATLWVAATMIGMAALHQNTQEMAEALKPGATAQLCPEWGNLFLRGKGGITIYGFLPVMFMTIGSAVLMVFVSLLTKPPSQATLDKYFQPKHAPEVSPSALGPASGEARSA